MSRRLLAGRFEQRGQFESEGLAAKWIKLEDQTIRPGGGKKGKEFIYPHLLGLIELEIRIAGFQAGELIIHLQTGEFQETEGLFPDLDIRSADDHCHLVIDAAGPADFQAAVKMADTEHMLTIVEDFHGQADSWML